jgi:hypothetical protein
MEMGHHKEVGERALEKMRRCTVKTYYRHLEEIHRSYLSEDLSISTHERKERKVDEI